MGAESGAIVVFVSWTLRSKKPVLTAASAAKKTTMLESELHHGCRVSKNRVVIALKAASARSLVFTILNY